MANRLGCEAVFSSAAVEFFVGQTKRRKQKILDRVHELVADPFFVPDFQSADATGREVFQFMRDGFIFDYWVDHAVKQVIVTGIDHIE